MTDLSGTWLGTYWQQGIPTRFELTLLQGGNALSGRILDDSHLGEAAIAGEVIGRNISFTKRYLNNSGYLVKYTGIVAENNKFMSGKWTINLFDSGSWEAYRSEDNLSFKIETPQSEKVPISISK